MNNQRNTQRQLLLGVFFIVALSILAGYTLFLTDIHLFSKPILMTVYFEDANNLREGDQVQLLGAKIGRVKEVTANVAADKKKRIRVVISLEKKIELLEDAEIMIRETSLLGGRHVFIDPGTFGGPVLVALEDGAFYGSVYKNPISMLGDIGQLFNDNRESITQAFLNIRKISDDIAQGKGLIGRLVTDETMGTDAKKVFADASVIAGDVREATAQLKSGKGLLGAVFYDEALKQQFSDTIASLKQIGDDLKSQQGVLGALIYDQPLKDRVTKGIDSFVSFGEKLNSGEGALGLLMNDKATKEKIEGLVTDLNATMADVRTIVADAKAGKGTLGKLLTDDKLIVELEKAVGVLTRSLEDYREAAPITSFTSVLFAAF
jgi:phospholipid/cholesterol/gamma-HCH transport system substrate-binding protein